MLLPWKIPKVGPLCLCLSDAECTLYLLSLLPVLQQLEKHAQQRGGMTTAIIVSLPRALPYSNLWPQPISMFLGSEGIEPCPDGPRMRSLVLV